MEIVSNWYNSTSTKFF